jgi:hypothetical protein
MSYTGDSQQQPTPGLHHSHPKTSDLLHHLLDGLEGEKVSVGWVVERLGSRSFGAIILLMGLPNVIPQIPGMSTIFGLLIMLPAMQLVLGLRTMWLPSYLARIMLPCDKVASVVKLAIPWVQKFEKMIKPRLTVLTYPPMENIIGALVLLLGFILFLPIPGGNWLPAMSCCLFALGMLERDGLFTLLGLAAAIGSVVIVGAIFAGLWHVIDSYLF